MEQRPSTVRCAVTAQVSVLKGSSLPLPAELLYGTADPYAVRLSLGSSTGPPVTWVFARELLDEGTRRPVGPGAVLVVPRYCHPPRSVRVVLSDDIGAALVELPAAEVAAFLRQTFALVPAGTESDHLDLDGALAELIGKNG